MAPLTAEYNSPSDSKRFEHDAPALPENLSVDEKTAYLASLRSSLSKLRGEINAFLTEKMEQDNVADKQEEENYGEEVVT
jgi:hypothetical protein